MDIFHWYLISNLVWLILIIIMISIKASWLDLMVIAIIINLIGWLAIPTSFYITISFNLLVLFASLYGYLIDRFKE